jgi:hypothetical protein
MSLWRSRIARHPPKVKAAGSSPAGDAMARISLVREAVCKTVVARVQIPGVPPSIHRPVVQRTGRLGPNEQVRVRLPPGRLKVLTLWGVSGLDAEVDVARRCRAVEPLPVLDTKKKDQPGRRGSLFPGEG